MLGVGRMGRPERIGHGVVHVGFAHRLVAARPATRHIPPPQKLRRLGAGPVSRIRCDCRGRHGQRLQRRGGGQVAHRLGGHDPEPAQITRIVAPALQGALLGQHMDHHAGRRSRAVAGRTGRAVRPPALTGQGGFQAAHRPARIGAALGVAARIVGAHRGRQRLQPGIHRCRVAHLPPSPLPLTSTPFRTRAPRRMWRPTHRCGHATCSSTASSTSRPGRRWPHPAPPSPRRRHSRCGR